MARTNTNSTTAQTTKQSGNGRIVILVIGVVVLIGSLLSNLVLGGMVVALALRSATSQSDLQEQVIGGSDQLARNKIAVINITGTIASSSEMLPTLSATGASAEDVVRQLDTAQNDPDVQAVVLFIDSPGGEVVASDDLYQKITSVAQTLPVVAYINRSGTSGAYMAAVASNHIIANPASLNGSIGVILQTYDAQELLNKAGVRLHTYTSGPLKNLLGIDHSPSSDESAIAQGIVDESYQLFVDHVAEGRGMDRSAVEKLADGRVYTAQQALDHKLIDAIGYREDAYAKAAELAQISSYALVTYELPQSFWSRLGLAGLSKLDLLGSLKGIPSQGMRMMFL